MQRDPGGWRLELGVLIAVTLTIVISTPRYHVALVDPIPAGCEIINPELAPSGGLETDGIDRYRWPVRHIYDDRLELFANHLGPGSYALTYLLRTTSAGRFTVPGTIVEEMYHPEVAGRAAAAEVVIA